MNKATHLTRLGFYLTAPHPCSYLPDRQAKALFADPEGARDNHVYTLLSRAGFRRSGEHIYRPRCEGCQDCVPVRVPVVAFQPNRIQRRTLRRNQDLSVRILPPDFQDEHYALYQIYQVERHAGGGMDDQRPESYLSFLSSTWSNTLFHEFRLEGRLIAITVVDELDDALSAVYTFFDPAFASRSLGRFAVLYGLDLALTRGLPWVYLGFWVQGCRKMGYKDEYRPLEGFRDGRWSRLP